MKTLDCEHPTITLRLPPCAGSEPTAELTRGNHVSVPLVRTTTDAEMFEFTFPEPFPAHIPFPARGVWALNAETGCGCYTSNVYVNCPAPMFASVHTPSLASGPSVECCVEEGDIVFSIDTLDPPTITADDYPLAELLVDEATAYAVRFNSPLTGGYTITNESGVALASGTFGALGTTQYHLLDLTCTSYIVKLNPPENA